MNNADRLLSIRRFAKGFGILIVIVSLVWLYVYAYGRIRIERLDETFGRAADTGQREEYFARKFPTSFEIDEYLSDTTILYSTPPWGNNVFYFDKNKGYVDWRDKNAEAGKWWTTPQLRIMVLDGRWRIAVVNTFCMWFFDRPAVAQQDNCYSVEKLDSILAADSSRGWKRESRKGNVFSLVRNTPAPARLPNTEIDIDSLLAIQPSGRGS